jgi:NAD(P)-dependent dehydrogenase (short-subunit alcohol dehydrogenase family)
MKPAVAPQVPSILGRAAGLLVNVQGGVDDERLADAVEGRVVLVTGASRGIGEATARRLGAAGATVLLAARSEEPLERLAEEIAELGGTAEAMPADLSDPEDARRLAEAALERHGHVDVLVSNAGKSINRSVRASLDRFRDYQRTIDLNYLGPVQLVLALLPSMLERGSGHIVNVSTAGVFAPAPVGWSAYIGSKTAFDVFLRSAEIELADEGIEITSIYMTLVETDMSAPSADTFRYVPALSAEEAADRVCAGIAAGSSRLAPWWTTPAAVWGSLSHLSGNLATRMFVRVNKQIARRGRENE